MLFFTCIYNMQLYNRRRKYVRKNEQMYWDDIDVSFMSEESVDSNDESVVHHHKHLWRSAGTIVLS